MKKLLTTILLALPLMAAAQQDEVLMTIDGKPVYTSEFNYIYEKNNTAAALDHKSKEDYLDLFVNFKLKVAEAEAQGVDTTEQFRRELAGYRNQLARPYLTDSTKLNQLVDEAFRRMQEDVEVAHIAIQAQGDDTLSAYNRILAAYERVNSGVPSKANANPMPEDFSIVASQMSDDQQSAARGGYVGWISPFRSVYAFENAAYNTPVGGVSLPFRSPYGYHIVKVLARRPAAGEVRVAHIMLFTDRQSEEVNIAAKNRIDSLYDRAMAGDDFAALASAWSQDHGTASAGGELPWFGPGRMVPEFEQAAFALNHPGDISKPVRSQYGWHIIRLLERRHNNELTPELHRDLLTQVERDQRGRLVEASFIDHLKQAYHFQRFEDNIDRYKETVIHLNVGDSLFSRFAAPQTQPLFRFDNMTITGADLTGFLNGRLPRNAELTSVLLDRELDEYIRTALRNREIEELPRRNADLRNLLQEYHDGILLFDVSSSEVWEKAQADTAGLEACFAAHRGNYQWNRPRFKGQVFYCADADVARTALALAKHSSDADLLADNLRLRLNTDSLERVRIEPCLVAADDQQLTPAVTLVRSALFSGKKDPKAGVVKPRIAATADEQYPQAVLTGNIITTPESWTDVRGLVTADYQEQLEQQWLQTLRQKHRVVINQDVWQRIK